MKRCGLPMRQSLRPICRSRLLAPTLKTGSSHRQMTNNAHIERLNRRLGEALGMVCSGSRPRFAWKWAPDQPHIVYGRDNRTLIKRTWADKIGMDGKPIGRVWVLAQWRVTSAADHHGYGTGVRVAVMAPAGYKPHMETALSPGEVPSEHLNQNYIWALDRQLSASAEHDKNAILNALAEEKYEDQRNETRDAKEWRESALGDYDQHVGAFGNCRPGTAGGFMSFGGI